MTSSSTRNAVCLCGQLSAACVGDPVRVSVCHCTACQRRTGSAFGTQARFPASSVTLSGAATPYTRIADSGHALTFHFCPVCGSTVYYTNDALPGFIGIALGTFAGAATWTPTFSVYECHKHPWVEFPDSIEGSG